MGTIQLNEYLQPIGAPVSNPAGTAIAGFDFSNEISRSSIMPAAIQNFNFNQGRGGTLNLGGSIGGSANVNGVLSVKNASNSEIVQLNNNGITVTNGSITVKNSSGSTTLDNLGVVSVQNFANVNASQAGGLNQGVTGTADVLLTSGSLSVVTARAINVLFLLNLSAYMVQTAGTNVGNGVVKLKIDGVEAERVVVDAGVVSDHTTGVHYLYPSLAAGTHPFTVTGNVNTLIGNGGTMTIYAYRMTYILLGT
jgi:hypothetical protein